MQLIDEIKKFFRGEVLASPSVLKKYSHDASIFEVVPELVVRPVDREDLEQLVLFVGREKAKHNNLSLTARSGGTDMSGGSLGQSIVIDFISHFNHIGEVKYNTIEVQPGTYYRDFEKATLKHGLIMPSYPASKNICAIGGMVANNAGGEKSLSYGQTKDYVEELHVILRDGQEYKFGELDEQQLKHKMSELNLEGEVYRKVYQLITQNWELIKKKQPTTSKNSSGYFLWDVWNPEKKTFNLAKLFTGSQGTLGLITNVKFLLVHPKPRSELLVIFMNDLKDLGKVVHTVAGFNPESFESFDRHTYSMAMRYLPDMIRLMKGSGFSLLKQFLPELWMMLTGGMPELVLIAEFTGESDEEVFAQLRKAEAAVRQQFHLKTHVTRDESETQKYWTIRRESFNLLRQHSKGKHTAPFIDDIVVHPDQLPEFLPKLNAIFAKYPHLLYTIAGHAGDANFHIIPIMDLHLETERQIIPALSNEVYDLVFEYNGSIAAEHNDGIIRTPFVEKMFGPEMTKLFQEVKKIFDPDNIFNPGKKVGGTMEYALRHIKKL